MNVLVYENSQSKDISVYYIRPIIEFRKKFIVINGNDFCLDSDQDFTLDLSQNDVNTIALKPVRFEDGHCYYSIDFIFMSDNVLHYYEKNEGFLRMELV